MVSCFYKHLPVSTKQGIKFCYNVKNTDYKKII